LVFVSITDPYYLDHIETLKKDRDHWRNRAIEAARLVAELRAELEDARLAMRLAATGVENSRRAIDQFKDAITDAEEELAIYRAALFAGRDPWYCPLCHGNHVTGHAPGCEAALRCDPEPESPQ
jgi:hypothetical protein